MKRVLVLTFMFGLALVLIVACTQVTPTATELPPTVEETQEKLTEETEPLSPTSTQTEVAETEPPATETPTQEPTAAEPTEELDAVEALIVERCSECHDADRVFRADKSEAQWEATIDRMVDYGADVSAEEKERMIEWLISRDQ